MNKFAKLWFASCFSYSGSIFISLLLDGQMLGGERADALLLILFHVFSLVSVFLFLQVCCAIEHLPPKHFWARYILLLLLYSAVLSFSSAQQILILLPFFLCQLLMMVAVIYLLLRKWTFSLSVKIVSALLICGCSIFPLYWSLSFLSGKSSFLYLWINIGLLLLLNLHFTFLHQRYWQRARGIQEDYLYVLAEKAADIVFYYALQPYARFSFISPSVEHIVGYKQEDFYKNPMLYLELTHEEDRAVIENAFSLAASAVNKNFIRWQRKDGEYLYLEFHNTPIFDGDRLTAVEGIFRDITDQKRAEKEMLDSRKSKQLLLSYISHELKTPITYIVGYAEALQKNLYQNEAEQKKAVDLIADKSIFLQKLVDDLFQLSKMEANQFSFEFVQMKVHQLASFLGKKYEAELADAGIDYLLETDPRLNDEDYEVLVDLKRIEQVYSNLLHNAIRFTPCGGRIKWQCFLEEKRGQIVFKMTDSGEGIPQKDLPYIFKAFYRGKSSPKGSKEGSGLGLSLSAQIIQAHRGEIEAESSKGKGSTFRFTIPLYREEE